MREAFFIPRRSFEPAYLQLFESGELRQRLKLALGALESCRLCPRDCNVDRLKNRVGVCKTGVMRWSAAISLTSAKKTACVAAEARARSSSHNAICAVCFVRTMTSAGAGGTNHITP